MTEQSAGQQSTSSSVEIRDYRGTQEDLQALTEVRNATLQATTLPEDYSRFSAREMSDYYNQSDYSLEGNAWLLFAAEKAAGAAILYPPSAFYDRPPGNFHLYIVPAFWRHGLGGVLLDHLERQAIARLYPVLETTIAAEDGRSTRFLNDKGFSVVGHSHHLVRQSKSPAEEVSLPEGYEVRSLQDLGADAELYGDTANRLGSYEANYALISKEDLDSQVEQGRFHGAGVFLLLDRSGRIDGVIRASMEPGSARGYLSEIRLEPSSRGKGLGRALVAVALKYLDNSGVERVELDIAGENMAAYNLATRSGFVEARHWLHFLKRLGTPGTQA